MNPNQVYFARQVRQTTQKDLVTYAQARLRYEEPEVTPAMLRIAARFRESILKDFDYQPPERALERQI